MTLTEYLHQTDPKREVIVILQKGEYRKRGVAYYCGIDYNLFEIPAIRERFNITEPYIHVGENPRLFTSNPITGKLQESVFFLPIDDTESLLPDKH